VEELLAQLRAAKAALAAAEIELKELRAEVRMLRRRPTPPEPVVPDPLPIEEGDVSSELSSWRRTKLSAEEEAGARQYERDAAAARASSLQKAETEMQADATTLYVMNRRQAGLSVAEGVVEAWQKGGGGEKGSKRGSGKAGAPKGGGAKGGGTRSVKRVPTSEALPEAQIDGGGASASGGAAAPPTSVADGAGPADGADALSSRLARMQQRLEREY
jgi:hypothetical protein